MHYDICGYRASDIDVVAAFDIDKRKVGKDIAQAIFAPQNCTKVFYPDVPRKNVSVKMGPVLDGVAPHMRSYPAEKRFVIADEQPCDVREELISSEADVLVNYMPVGSEEAPVLCPGGTGRWSWLCKLHACFHSLQSPVGSQIPGGRSSNCGR